MPIALAKNEFVQVTVHQLVVDPLSQQPVVSLTDQDEKRVLLISIGHAEARAIFLELQGIRHLRPLTHDLLESIIQKVDGKIRKIFITHIKNSIFYATIVIDKNGGLLEIDARPSDSIVMALKFKAPIFVSKPLFDKMSVTIEAPQNIEEEYGLTLQELTPELSKYLSFQSSHGVLVYGLRKDSRADHDGIEVGDIIVEIDEQPIEDMSSLKQAFAKSKTVVKARIFRKSRFLSLPLHLK